MWSCEQKNLQFLIVYVMLGQTFEIKIICFQWRWNEQSTTSKQSSNKETILIN
jgi:hypothetical protein